MKRIIAFVLALCLMLPLLTSCDKVSETPAEALSNAFEFSAKSLKSDRSADVMEAASNGGSVEFSMDFTSILSFLTGAQLENKLGLNLKSYSAKKGTVSASVLGLLVDDRTLAEANMFIDSEKFVMTSEELLGSNAYGATLEAITKLLDESVPGFSEAILQNSANANMAANAELVGVITKYGKLFSDTLFDTCPAERIKNSLTIGDETVDAVSFKMNVTAAQAAKILRTVYNAFMADADAKKVVDKFLAANNLNSPDTDIYKEFDEDIAELEEDAADYKSSINVSLDFNAKVGNLMQIYIEPTDPEQAGEYIALILGVDPTSPEYAAFKMNMDEESLSFEVKTVEDTKEKLKKEFTLKSDSNGQSITLPAVLDYDRATEKYSIELTLPEALTASMMLPAGTKGVVSAGGVYKSTKDSIIFTLDGISANMGSALSFNLDLSLKLTVLAKDGGMPSAPESYKDITKEEVQTELLNELDTNLAEILNMLPEGLLELFY